MRLSLLLPGSGFPKLRSAVTLLEDEGRRILVDSGLVDDGEKLVARLAACGIGPEEVDTIIATHLHYDHCGNHLLFPNAEYLAGASDLEDTRTFIAFFHADQSPSKSQTAELLRSKYESIKEFYVRSIIREVTRNLAFYNRLLDDERRFTPLVGPAWLTSGIEIVPTPGHTPGHLSVVAHGATLENGETGSVLIGGDAVFTRATVADDREIHLAWDAETYRRTRSELLARYRWVIPGHDGLSDMHAAQQDEAAPLFASGAVA
ncbi:MAG TPA: MBL fold metallo-hydrolase [Thermoanaerobaculia bacterium]|jgi:glyoxylase-like metal-dependent hydrolase (beta-lactamase superfamily II)